jgi:aldehyde dehydrogenase (NAD+)
MLSFDPGALAPDARPFIGRAALAGTTADPVLSLENFSTEEEALALAHHATYGFCAGVYTRDLSRALRAMKRIEAGTVWVNRYGRSRDASCRRAATGPRASGLGREAYHANRRSKSVLIDLGREAA